MRIDPEEADRVGELCSRDLDWDNLLSTALRNGLLPLLYFHLNSSCASLIPTERYQYLRDYAQKNSAFNLLLTGELLHLVDVFKANGISALPYKGPALAVKIYGNLLHRQFCDLDVLVQEHDVWKAAELLESEGFEPHFRIPPKKRQAFLRLSYVSLFRRDAGRSLVELHWRIAPRFFGVRFNEGLFWSRLQTIMLRDTSVLTPAPEDLLLMLCVHGAKDCWEKLEWVAALAELIRSTPEMDWYYVRHQAQAMRAERILRFGLILAASLPDVTLPAQIEGQLKNEARLVPLAQCVMNDFFVTRAQSRSVSSRLAFHLALKDNSGDKLRHCVRLATTTTPVDWAMTPLPAPLSFVYPLLRAARLTRKYGLSAAPASDQVCLPPE